MKITAVEPLVLGTSWRNLIFLKVSTDEGLVGIGECTLQNREEGVLGYLQGAVRRHVLGTDPFNIEDLWLRMYRNEFWRGGPIATTVMSGIEIACWDIVGKAVGQPVWRLLGGRCHEKVKAYANAWYTVERTPQEFAKRVKVVLEKGYKALKVDPFGPGTLELSREEKIRSVDLVAAIREAVGPAVEIFVEMHGRFSAATAIEMARLLEPYQPGWIEEPCPPEDIPSLKKVAEHVRIPVAAGERYFTHYGFREVIESDAPDILQPERHPLGWNSEPEKDCGHGGCPQHGDGAAQLQRPGLHGGQRAFRFLHDQPQGAGMLRRFLGDLGRRGRAWNTASEGRLLPPSARAWAGRFPQRRPDQGASLQGGILQHVRA